MQFNPITSLVCRIWMMAKYEIKTQINNFLADYLINPCEQFLYC